MKTYLCIGAGPGISVATARRFGREGYRIVLVSRSAADNDQLQGLLKDEKVDVRYESADASSPTQVAAVIEKYKDDNLAVVHYNAAVMHFDKAGALVMQGIEKQTPAAIASDITVNVSGALVTLSKIIPIMTAQKSGTILLTGGGLGVTPSAELLTLSVGKAAMRTVGQALFEPLKQHSVHIASVRVSTLVASDSAHPEKIAEEFWALHAQVKDAWTWETIYPATHTAAKTQGDHHE